MATTEIYKNKCRDDVCGSCPGTMWGQKSICRVHDKSIGLIDSCVQWEHVQTPTIENEQLELFDISNVMEVIQRVEQELKDYNWMIREVRRLERLIDQAEDDSGACISTRLVATYGIDAAMPKPQGKKLASLNMDEKQYDRMVKRYQKLNKQTSNITNATYIITNERERTILECILDGVQMKVTAFHVGVSRQRMNEIKQEVIRKMAWEMYGDELKNMVYTSDVSDRSDTSDVSDVN